MSKRERKRLEKRAEDLSSLPKLTRAIIDLHKEFIDLKERLKNIEDYIKRKEKQREARWTFLRGCAQRIGAPLVVGVVMFIIGWLAH